MTLVVEGTADAAVARRLLQEVGLEPAHEYVTNGKSALDQRLGGYIITTRHVSRVGSFSETSTTMPTVGPIFAGTSFTIPRRICGSTCRSVPSRHWLLADAETISQSLSIPATRAPVDPEVVLQPKRALVDLARKLRRRTIREALVPAPGTTAKVGPGYSAFLTEFATEVWRPAIAAERSESLASLRSFLRSIQ